MNILTEHAQTRIRQRGIKESDIDFILDKGSFNSKGYMLTAKDCDGIVQEAKRLIRQANRLKGKFIAADGETVITAFPASRKQQRSFIRDIY